MSVFIWKSFTLPGKFEAFLSTGVALSGKEERTYYAAGFHRLADSVEVVEVAAAGMSTVVAVNSATG